MIGRYGRYIGPTSTPVWYSSSRRTEEYTAEHAEGVPDYALSRVHPYWYDSSPVTITEYFSGSALSRKTGGSRKPDVRQLQTRLYAHGLLGVDDADGVYGAKTEAAVKRMQTFLGLPATGVFDYATYDKLSAFEITQSYYYPMTGINPLRAQAAPTPAPTAAPTSVSASSQPKPAPAPAPAPASSGGGFQAPGIALTGWAAANPAIVGATVFGLLVLSFLIPGDSRRKK